MELKELQEELGKAVAEGLNPLREQIETEVKRLGEETAETKQAWERVNEKLDEFEIRMQKMALQGDGRGRGSTPDSPAKKAFDEWARKGTLPGADAPDEVKALIFSDDTTGGFLATQDLETQIMKGVQEFSPVRSLARIRQTSADAVRFPKRTGVLSARWAGEQETRTETTGYKLGIERVPVHELYALVDISKIDLEDTAFDLESELRMEFEEQFGVAEGTAFVTGDAVKKPEGFAANATLLDNATQTATDNTFAADDLITTYYALKSTYSRNGTWGLNRAMLATIRKLKDAVNGNYLWQPGLAGLAPATILDRPYVEMPDMASSVADGAIIAVFGDFKRGYLVADRVGIEVQRDPYTQATEGVVRFIARKRVGGQVINTEALRLLKVQ